MEFSIKRALKVWCFVAKMYTQAGVNYKTASETHKMPEHAIKNNKIHIVSVAFLFFVQLPSHNNNKINIVYKKCKTTFNFYCWNLVQHLQL